MGLVITTLLARSESAVAYDSKGENESGAKIRFEQLPTIVANQHRLVRVFQNLRAVRSSTRMKDRQRYMNPLNAKRRSGCSA